MTKTEKQDTKSVLHAFCCLGLGVYDTLCLLLLLMQEGTTFWTHGANDPGLEEKHFFSSSFHGQILKSKKAFFSGKTFSSTVCLLAKST